MTADVLQEAIQRSYGGMFASAGAALPTHNAPPVPEAVAPATVTIVVKNVYRNTSIELALPDGTPLSSVKAAISERFDEHPAPDQQRLIYLGKVCADDGLLLKDILSSSKIDVQAPQTFHLVLSSNARSTSSASLPSASNAPTNSAASQPQRSIPPATAALPASDEWSQADSAYANVLMAEGLRRRRVQSNSEDEGTRRSGEQAGDGADASAPLQQRHTASQPLSADYTQQMHPQHHHASQSAAPDMATLQAHWYQAAYAQWAVQQQMYYSMHTGVPSAFPYQPGAIPTPFNMVPSYTTPHTYAPQQPPAQAGLFTNIPLSHHAPVPVTTTYTAAFVPPMTQPLADPYASAVHSNTDSINHTNNTGAAAEVVAPRRTTWTVLSERAREVVRLLDWQLAVKMAMMVFLLHPNDPQRLFTLGFIAVAAYLYQTGILGLLLGPAFGYARVDDEGFEVPPPQANQNQPQPQPQGGDRAAIVPQGPAAGGTTAVIGRGVLRRDDGLVQKLWTVCQGTIPTEPSFALDCVVMVSSIFLSLIPAWDPVTAPSAAGENHAELPPAPEVAAGQG